MNKKNAKAKYRIGNYYWIHLNYGFSEQRMLKIFDRSVYLKLNSFEQKNRLTAFFTSPKAVKVSVPSLSM